jgi:hypothetical protein
MRLELNTETREEMVQVLTGLLKALNEERELPSGQLKLDDKYVGDFEPNE